MSEKVILCIDDERIILDSIKSQLIRNLGDEFIFEFAEDANEGLELLDELMSEDSQILLIVSDWLMPGMKGDEFLIKVHQKYPNLKKILLSGQADTEAVERAVQEAGLYKFMNKPWDEKELIETIKNIVNQ